MSEYKSIKDYDPLVPLQCERCGHINTPDQLVDRTEIKCYRCGCRVLKKMKPPVVRRIKSV